MFLGHTLSGVDRHTEAIAAFEKALAINPHNLEALAFMGATMALAGDRVKALEVLEKVKATEDRFEPAIHIAAVYAGLGDIDEMLRYLHLAYERKSSPIYLVTFSSYFKRHHSDQRLRAFISSLGLPLPGQV